MTIDEAIEDLFNLTEQDYWEKTPLAVNAIKLGAEALKAVKAMRQYPFPEGILSLPGETKE